MAVLASARGNNAKKVKKKDSKPSGNYMPRLS
jgi:hypothetical protein